MNLRIIKTDKPLRAPAVKALRERSHGGKVVAGRFEPELDVSGTVRAILKEVNSRKDKALLEYSNRLDGTDYSRPGDFVVTKDELKSAHEKIDEGFLELIRRSVANIRQYQESILLAEPAALEQAGRQLSLRYRPIGRVGVYVPGGEAVYPSTVLMTVVPAQVAGVGKIAIVSPPTCGGDINPMILALAHELGVAEVYRVGGAQAIAALAYGTNKIKKVDKIVGPGNAFVAEAKRQLFGRVGIDSIAGPSEVLIIADESARADWLAADMLAQAEHDPGSAVLVTTSEKLANAVVAAIDEELPKLNRKDAIEAAMEDYSAIIVVPDIDTACEAANDFAPEHLQIITADDESALAKIRCAGAIFLGAFTPVPLGDYYAGPSHVLPTGGTARFFGPLSANDFMVASSVIRYDASALADDADDVIAFAKREGLTAHARAIEIRKLAANNANKNR